MRVFSIALCFFVSSLVGCQDVLENDLSMNCNTTSIEKDQRSGALIATRFKEFEDLRSAVKIDHYEDQLKLDSASEQSEMVVLTQCGMNQVVVSKLKKGISQGDISKAKDGDIWEKLELLISSPYAVANRKNLEKVLVLARWRNDLFGWKDVAFYDLAQAAERKIITKDMAYLNPLDSSEKGFINTFNHVTAQAFITTCFSEEFADFIGDVHERENLPEMITGVFTEHQLTNPLNNPMDNYVDMLNNEWGQELGVMLKDKLNINKNTFWTPELLVEYLNELQSFYSNSFKIGMEPFRVEEEVVGKFAEKLNRVMRGEY